MIGFLSKVDRRDVLPYVHGGWAAALVAGLITWGVAAYAFDIDGASREFTEGFAALFAAVILVAVGIWMHGKSLAGRWQAYLKEQISSALSKSSAWFLFGLAFVAVYREVFETILFYIALWARGNVGAIVGGFFAGVVVLAVITVVMLRTSKRLPISQFFAWSSALVALLAIVMAGKGVAALQEGGQLPPSVVDFPRLEVLGVYPSLYSLLAQLAVIVVIVVGYIYNTRSAAKELPKAA
jgi:high-affinity iron transporter